MHNNNRKKPTFKAPQSALRSSWVDTPFTKPKACQIIKRSLGRKATPIIKSIGGQMASLSNSNSNQY